MGAPPPGPSRRSLIQCLGRPASEAASRGSSHTGSWSLSQWSRRGRAPGSVVACGGSRCPRRMATLRPTGLYSRACTSDAASNPVSMAAPTCPVPET
jgi:hypothetical protein